MNTRSLYPLPFLIVVGWLLLLPGASPAQQMDTKAVDAAVREARQQWDVPGVAVVVVRGDKVVYVKGFGARELGKPDPVTPETLFPLGSCTKAFTTLALAMLVDEGKMNWDDPVRKHLPYFRLADPLADANVTIRDLVCHRAGLGTHDLLWYRAPWDLEEQIRRVGRVQPSYSFRSAFHYQNLMFVAAGLAMARSAGQPWDEFVQSRIFDPLEMRASHCRSAAALKAPDRATPHRVGPDGKLRIVPWYEFAEPNPAGSITTSANDLGKWLRFQLGDGSWQGKRLVTPENFGETRTPQMIIRLEGITRAEHPFTAQMTYGMGWVLQDYRGHPLASHTGIIDGMRVHIAMAPLSRLGIGILANRHATRMNLALSNTLLDQLLGLPYEEWNKHYLGLVRAGEEAEKAAVAERQAHRQPNTKPTHALADYAGAYEDPAYGTASVLLENGALVWKWSTFRVPLEHYHFDTFTARDPILGAPFAAFRLGATGEVEGLRILDVDFKKVRAKK